MFKYDDATDNKVTSENSGKQSQGDSRIFLGIMLVLIGVVLIARNYGWLDYEFSRYLISWQMLLIAIGVYNLSRRAYTSAIALIGIGLFFLIDIPEDLRENFWPALIVLVGLSFILKWRQPRSRSRSAEKDNSSSRATDFMDETAIFGGRNISVVSETFQGGKITAIFGGSKINLLYAKPVEGCTLDVVTLFGGAKIIVPEDWNVKIEVVSIFGGFEDKRSLSVISRSGSGKIVVIKGSCIFGGGEITTMP